jgi:hypothetical protein
MSRAKREKSKLFCPRPLWGSLFAPFSGEFSPSRTPRVLVPAPPLSRRQKRLSYINVEIKGQIYIYVGLRVIRLRRLEAGSRKWKSGNGGKEGEVSPSLPNCAPLVCPLPPQRGAAAPRNAPCLRPGGRRRGGRRGARSAGRGGGGTRRPSSGQTPSSPAASSMWRSG